ncbi:fez family zinc finger protein 1-like [Hermetia illucens]|uniref:fez family zinc finger protein 1-like n=1 Tax=Hermetia illucens TaxID=343691 RepID=UPI0018CC738B|nr:fez family zinc finger protein 1-like [Hermetia illucens]
MVTTCVVCNVTNRGMINIFEHPRHLDYMLNFVTEHKVERNDFLCVTCYDELKIAFKFKQECQRSRVYRGTPKYVVEAFGSEVASSLDDFSATFFEIPKSPGTRLTYELQHRHRAQIHSSSAKNKRRHRNKQRRRPISKYADNDINKNLGQGQCEYCFVILATVELLQEHKSQHKEERPYSCNQPNWTARFKHRYSVRSHVRVHSDQKRYKCRFCSKGFHKRGNLKAHERCHSVVPTEI